MLRPFKNEFSNKFNFQSCWRLTRSLEYEELRKKRRGSPHDWRPFPSFVAGCQLKKWFYPGQKSSVGLPAAKAHLSHDRPICPFNSTKTFPLSLVSVSSFFLNFWQFPILAYSFLSARTKSSCSSSSPCAHRIWKCFWLPLWPSWCRWQAKIATSKPQRKTSKMSDFDSTGYRVPNGGERTSDFWIIRRAGVVVCCDVMWWEEDNPDFLNWRKNMVDERNIKKLSFAIL